MLKCFADNNDVLEKQDNNDVFEKQDENVMQLLMLLHHGYKHNRESHNKENRRNIDNDLENWTGRWMPDRPDDATPPPKILPNNKRLYEYESITEYPHDMYMGHVSPECDDARVNITFNHIDCPY